MRGIGLLCAAVLFPVLAYAAPLRVQTGEHATFTRVVIGVPRGVDWQLGRTAEGYGLRLPAPDGFALDQFFDLIPRDRIASVSQDVERGELRLRVDCQCHAQAVIYQSEYLVIDIRDGPALVGSPFELALAQDEPVEARAESLPAARPSFPIARNPVLPLITPRFPLTKEPSDIPQPVVEAPATIASPTEPEAEFTPEQDTDAALQLIAQALGESLGRGLSDGLLQEGVVINDGDMPDNGLEDIFTIEGGTPLPGLNTRTGIDPLAVSGDDQQPQTQEGRVCLPDSSFDVAEWGDDSPPHVQLRQARMALVTPMDAFADGALRDLARLYVHLGFGYEARQTLDLEGAQSRDRILLRAIARIIDDEPVAAELFAGQVSCASHVALWALLAQPRGPLDAQVDRTAVINAYRALPVYVQRPIAPRLAEALLAIGAEDEAMQVLGRQPADAREDVALALADAALSGALGEDAQAIEKVVDVARNDRRANPEAMVRFFNEGTVQELAFSDADFLLADALLFEHAGTQAATDLAMAQFDAYLSVDRFQDARALLKVRELPIDELNSHRARLYQVATERMPDAAFLEFVWQEDFGRDTVETQNAVGARLLALRFPTQALAVMPGWASGEIATEQERLRELAMRQAAAQEPALEESMDSDPNTISAASETLDTEITGNPTLRNSRALVESAEQSRATIRALLQTVPAPTDF